MSGTINNNPNFNCIEFEAIKNEAGLNSIEGMEEIL